MIDNIVISSLFKLWQWNNKSYRDIDTYREDPTVIFLKDRNVIVVHPSLYDKLREYCNPYPLSPITIGETRAFIPSFCDISSIKVISSPLITTKVKVDVRKELILP